MLNSVQVHWQKIKFKHLGTQGVSELDYNINNGRFNQKGVFDNISLIGNTYYSPKIEPNVDFWNEPNTDDVPF